VIPVIYAIEAFLAISCPAFNLSFKAASALAHLIPYSDFNIKSNSSLDLALLSTFKLNPSKAV
jgi:hypothetical protein